MLTDNASYWRDLCRISTLASAHIRSKAREILNSIASSRCRAPTYAYPQLLSSTVMLEQRNKYDKCKNCA